MPFLNFDTVETVKIGPFLDETDGITPMVGLTINQADVRLTKNGGNYAQKNDANACTHDEEGEYNCQLNATDKNTKGRMRLMVKMAGAMEVWHDYWVGVLKPTRPVF